MPVITESCQAIFFGPVSSCSFLLTLPLPFCTPNTRSASSLTFHNHLSNGFTNLDLLEFWQMTCTLCTPSFNTYIFSWDFSSQFLQAHPEQFHICSTSPSRAGFSTKGAPVRFIMEYHSQLRLKSGCSDDPVFLHLQEQPFCQQGP